MHLCHNYYSLKIPSLYDYSNINVHNVEKFTILKLGIRHEVSQNEDSTAPWKYRGEGNSTLECRFMEGK